MAASIRRGVRVRAKATYFDENDGKNTWSRKHFGEDFNISYCWGTVRKVENNYARVYWEIDKKISTVPVGVLVADVVTENDNLLEADTYEEHSSSESDSSSSSEDETVSNSVHPTTSTSSVTNSSAGNTTVVKGVTWTFHEAIRVDQRQQGHFKATLLVPLGPARSVKDAFFMVFPRDKLSYIVQCTNSSIPARQKLLNEKELLIFFGILYAMTLQELPDRRSYWSTTSDGIFPPANFGQRFGMSRQRFEIILMALRFTQPSDLDYSDKWRNTRTFMTMVNDKLKGTISPGSKITVDESMFAWYGRGAYFKDGMPAVMKIKRKPKGVGCEVKTACDSGTNIMISMEINEGKEAMSMKNGQREFGAGTATTLRLTEPWHGSGRVIVGDSWFASVKTAVELFKVGLYFIGLVKTAHSFYPLSEMAAKVPTRKGAFVVSTAEKDSVQLTACAWRDKKIHTFIATCETTLPGLPSRKRRWDDEGNLFFKEVDRPKLVQKYFDGAAAIDIHNHIRQDGLALEKAWGTHKWEHRIYASLLGIIETNAYLIFNNFFRSEHDQVSHRWFTTNLVLALTDADTNQQENEPPPHENLALSGDHILEALSKSDERKRVQRKCIVCSRVHKKQQKASYFCKTCGPRCVLCSPQTGRNCFTYHITHGIPACYGR